MCQLLLPIASWIYWAWFVNGISGRISSHGCSHLQNGTWLAWTPGKMCSALRMRHEQKTLQCRILVHMSVLHQLPCKFYTADRTSNSPLHSCSQSSFVRGRKQLSLSARCAVWNLLRRGALGSGQSFVHSTAETEHEMYVGTFFISKRGSRFHSDTVKNIDT